MITATGERRPVISTLRAQERGNTEDMEINLLSLSRSALLPGDSWRQLVARPGCAHWRYLEMLHSNTSLQSAGGAAGQRRARSDCPSGLSLPCPAPGRAGRLRRAGRSVVIASELERIGHQNKLI
ncbi:unnamed protein product [Arctogadus glacialis]